MHATASCDTRGDQGAKHRSPYCGDDKLNIAALRSPPVSQDAAAWDYLVAAWKVHKHPSILLPSLLLRPRKACRLALTARTWCFCLQGGALPEETAGLGLPATSPLTPDSVQEEDSGSPDQLQNEDPGTNHNSSVTACALLAPGLKVWQHHFASHVSTCLTAGSSAWRLVRDAYGAASFLHFPGG